MQVKTPAPTFYKGDLVRPVREINGWRRMNADETSLWYAKFHEDCRAGRADWHDDGGGEPASSPRHLLHPHPGDDSHRHSREGFGPGNVRDEEALRPRLLPRQRTDAVHQPTGVDQQVVSMQPGSVPGILDS